jgi:hypothetical protein
MKTATRQIIERVEMVIAEKEEEGKILKAKIGEIYEFFKEVTLWLNKTEAVTKLRIYAQTSNCQMLFCKLDDKWQCAIHLNPQEGIGEVDLFMEKNRFLADYFPSKIGSPHYSSEIDRLYDFITDASVMAYAE